MNAPQPLEIADWRGFRAQENYFFLQVKWKFLTKKDPHNGGSFKEYY
jgi:hypothetical protein